ncbi:hypothetical protein [Nocardia rhizosphaerae]|uniref:Uncharacterized protein n=1 Tax=Nocardia rhizosphaerae TaxID=1691571 RepID=A0ABV8LEF7_9NOCA
MISQVLCGTLSAQPESVYGTMISHHNQPMNNQRTAATHLQRRADHPFIIETICAEDRIDLGAFRRCLDHTTEPGQTLF